jgi:uncharacterized protein YqeY
MSKVKDILKKDLKAAMVAKDNFKRDTIRFLMSAIKQVEIDERVELSDNDIYKIIQKSIKQRDDAAKAYKAANREDLYEKEVNEANLIKEYLPKQLSSDELRPIIQKIVDKTEAKSMKDMGKVIKLTQEEVGSSADGKTISSIVKEILS